MGKYDVAAEEEAIRKVLAGERRPRRRDPQDVDEVARGRRLDRLLARLMAEDRRRADTPATDGPQRASMPTDLDFLSDALEEVFKTPSRAAPNGVGWKQHAGTRAGRARAQRRPAARLAVLPQSYLSETAGQRAPGARHVDDPQGNEQLVAARGDEVDLVLAGGALPLARCTRCSTGPATALWPARPQPGLRGPQRPRRCRPSSSTASSPTSAARSSRRRSSCVRSPTRTTSDFAPADAATHRSAEALAGSAVRSTQHGRRRRHPQYERFVAQGHRRGRAHSWPISSETAGQAVVRRVQQWRERVPNGGSTTLTHWCSTRRCASRRSRRSQGAGAGRRDAAGPAAGPPAARRRGRGRLMPVSDALVVGEAWISEHYFTTDATKQSFQARVIERRKAWEEDKEHGTTRTRFTAARGGLLDALRQPRARRRLTACAELYETLAHGARLRPRRADARASTVRSPASPPPA